MSKTVTEHLREHLLDALGYAEPAKPVPDLDVLRQSEWNKLFEQMMRNRLVMGAFRYVPMSQQAPRMFRRIDAVRRCIDQYCATGNLEYLVDAANYTMLEFSHPSHPHAHFYATDDGQHCQRL